MSQIQRLKLLRTKINQSQAIIAQNLNITREAYSMYETGKRQPPYETLEAIARYYRVSTDYLIGVCDVPYSFADFNDQDLFIVKQLPVLEKSTKEYLIAVIKHDPSYLSRQKRIEASRKNDHKPGKKPEETVSSHFSNT